MVAETAELVFTFPAASYALAVNEYDPFAVVFVLNGNDHTLPD